jgi:PAS domain-containing protein
MGRASGKERTGSIGRRLMKLPGKAQRLDTWAFFEKLFASLPDAIVVVDHEGRIVEANPQVGSIFGYPLFGTAQDFEKSAFHSGNLCLRFHPLILLRPAFIADAICS